MFLDDRMSIFNPVEEFLAEESELSRCSATGLPGSWLLMQPYSQAKFRPNQRFLQGLYYRSKKSSRKTVSMQNTVAQITSHFLTITLGIPSAEY